MNGTYQLSTLANDFNSTGDDTRTIESNARALLNACMDTGLTVKRKNYTHGTLTSSEQDGKCAYHDRQKSFKYVCSVLTNKFSIHNEIKCRIKAGIPCYYSVQIHLSYRLLPKNFKIKIYIKQ